MGDKGIADREAIVRFLRDRADSFERHNHAERRTIHELRLCASVIENGWHDDG